MCALGDLVAKSAVVIDVSLAVSVASQGLVASIMVPRTAERSRPAAAASCPSAVPSFPTLTMPTVFILGAGEVVVCVELGVGVVVSLFILRVTVGE